MKKTTMAVAVAVLGLMANEAMAQQQSPWLVRARVVNIAPDNAVDSNVAGTGKDLTVSSKTIPEVDISYFFSPNIAAELILTYPQKHDVALGGGNIGSFKHLPPTLLAQYHFLPAGTLDPYLGVGLNYTRISSVNLQAVNGTLENHSFGVALQAGLDYKIDQNWSLNLDVKKIRIRSDLTVLGGVNGGTVKVDPLLVGVGVGYRF